ncbi:MAG: bifunctional UDP-N-acetylglucosamine diphosphorylase/glucosamine-1-phosphate N-acetyltransferase GlmU [Actinobacteria bacterium HGW-Actinobacteria-7]|nr:MAG: bifunctional UDP-N-acetylglucosamine diphosphorylase/glucosamine-1-phosphate N-acetyltransferase GlmU [Actinobacteria bacterium HGW-Actinobacteria-7]
MSATALILAAGEGTRMYSETPKVAHRVLGVPMIQLVVQTAQEAGCDHIVAITGHRADVVEALIPGVECARQDQQLGTGHAVMCAREALAGASGSLVVLSGDTPLMTSQTISGLIALRESSGSVATLLTAHVPDPAGYGRIVRGRDGQVEAIVEEKDCSPEQRSIREVNTGTYCFDAAVLFAHLDRLTTANAQGEYYLTDIVALFNSEGMTVSAMVTDDPLETLGVNTRVQLAEATKVLQARVNRRHLLAGVTMTDPQLVWISPQVSVGRDVEILPMTFLTGETTVADGVVLGPNTRISDSQIARGAVVDSSVLVSVVVGPDATVGPSAYLRPGTVLEARAKAGTSVEIKNSIVGEGSKVPHLSYIGDATIGRGVNVGAGTITCNYDGVSKHPTVIGDGAFIGSDTMLVAPVTIGEGAITGAGSAITHDVPPGALAIERSEQRAIEGWAARRRATRED